MKTCRYFLHASALFIISISVCLIYSTGDSDIKRKNYEVFIRNSFEEVSQNLQNKNTLSTYPQEAAFQEYIKTIDPLTKEIPKDKLFNLHQSILKDEWRYKNSKSIALNWKEIPSDLGGRTRAIMWDPTDSVNGYKKAWAGGVTGGLWYNNDVTNPDSAWHSVSDFWPNLAISCLTYDLNNPNIFYLGTGEAQTATYKYRESSGVGCGIFKSSDAGETWELLENTTGFKYITDIVVRDVGGTSEVLAGVASGNYKGIDHTSIPKNGLYRSTNGGDVWLQLMPNMPGTSTPWIPNDIEIASNNRIFIGTMRHMDETGGGYILYSDDGYFWSWSLVDDFIPYIEAEESFNIPGRVEVAVAPSNPNKVYALVTGGIESIPNMIIGRCFNIFSTEDGGLSWTKLNLPSDYPEANTGVPWAYIAWHALIAVVDPIDENSIIVGSVDLHKSTDGGYTWNYISSTQNMGQPELNDTTFVHADQHNILFKFNSSSEALFSNDGGVYYSSTCDQDYPHFEMRNKNFNTLQGYTCAIHPNLGTDYYLMGMQDNSTLAYDGTPFYRDNILLGGDGAYCFIDEDNPLQQIASIQWNLYAYTSDGFSTYVENEDFFRTGTFISPAAYDSKKNTLYSNGTTQDGYLLETIIKYEDIFDNFSAQQVHVSTNSIVPFSALTLSPYAPENEPTLFCGTEAGNLYKIKRINTTPVVYNITSTEFPTSNISSIDIGATGDHILVTFSNFGVFSVWETLNGGETWVNKEGNLQDIPVRWGIYNPVDRTKVMLATEMGIWTTQDISQQDVNWEIDNEGMANVRVDQLRLRKSDNMVVAATHGRGLFKTYFYPLPPGVNVEEVADIERLKMFPNPVKDILTLDFNELFAEKINIQIINQKGQILKHQSFEGSSFIELDCISLKPGIYFINILNKQQKTTRKFIKI